MTPSPSLGHGGLSNKGSAWHEGKGLMGALPTQVSLSGGEIQGRHEGRENRGKGI